MYLDLTMPLDEKTPVYPGDPKQQIEQIATVAKDGWAEKRLTFNSHLGTHIDAPSHMIEGGKTLDDFPIETFIGEAIVVTLGDISAVKKDDIVFFNTNHTKNAYDPGFFQNNPVLSTKLAEKLVELGVKIVGLDSFSPDKEPWPVHKVLLAHDILIVENLVNLDQLLGKRFMCYILPLKIKDGDGAPCRVVANV
jgi:arylformamidase